MEHCTKCVSVSVETDADEFVLWEEEILPPQIQEREQGVKGRRGGGGEEGELPPPKTETTFIFFQFVLHFCFVQFLFSSFLHVFEKCSFLFPPFFTFSFSTFYISDVILMFKFFHFPIFFCSIFQNCLLSDEIFHV